MLVTKLEVFSEIILYATALRCLYWKVTRKKQENQKVILKPQQKYSFPRKHLFLHRLTSQQESFTNQGYVVFNSSSHMSLEYL